MVRCVGRYFVPPIITTATSGAPAPLPPVVDPLAPRPLLLPPLAVAGAAGRGGVGGIRDARQVNGCSASGVGEA
jgi:hypothetical protein